MFESFRSKDKDKKLMSLDLGTPAPRPATPAPPPVAAPAPATAPTAKPEVKAEAKAPAAQICVGQTLTLEGAWVHFSGARRKFEEIVSADVKPEFLFYVVFPQQGLTHSLTTNDGLKTIMPVFTSKPMADAYVAAKTKGAVAAACRVETLPEQAEHWMSSGINTYALNACSRCVSFVLSPIAEMQAEESFVLTWRLDLANRRQFAESYGRNAAAVAGTNAKQARLWLEGIRDHIDPANPYLHWVIAVMAGVAGDMEANAAGIKRLEAFGPPFAGKLQGTSFDISTPGSQLGTLAEGMIGLGLSLGYLDKSKFTQAPKAADGN